MAPPPPNVHFVQMLMNGTILMGLDQQGNVWTGVLRPAGDGTYQIIWAAVNMVFSG